MTKFIRANHLAVSRDRRLPVVYGKTRTLPIRGSGPVERACADENSRKFRDYQTQINGGGSFL